MASNVNAYASLAELKGILGTSTTTDDTVMRKILEAASRSIENNLNRRFYSTSETKYFDGAAQVLWVPDLLSIDASGLKTDEDGDATFENTFATTDYILYGGGLEDALNLFPRTHIELTHDSDYAAFANGVRKGVQIAGVWGYGDGTSATPYVTDTTTAEAIDAGETAIDVTSGTNLSAGMTILVESEQMYITAVSTNTLTVEKGVNGTTDASHVTAKQVYYYRYPRDIMQACLDLGSALYEMRNKNKGLQSERLGDYGWTLAGTTLNKSMVESILSGVQGYRRLRV